MATATKKSRAAGQLARRARDVRQSASMEFVVSQDNVAKRRRQEL